MKHMRYLFTLLLCLGGVVGMGQKPASISSIITPIMGMDQTAAINTALASTTVSELVLDGGLPIVINGSIDAKGKVLHFETGNIITGVGTIRNAVYSFANKRSQAFGLQINHYNARCEDPFTTTAEFGTVGDGVTDDQPALQKASDVVISNPTLPRELEVYGGSYRIKSPWMIYNWSGGIYQQCNISIVGGKGVAGSPLNGYARIITSDSVSFAIGVQNAAGGGIYGVTVEGPWSCNMSHEQFYTLPWSSICHNRDSRYSPNAGIVIDPFTGTPPPDGGYPGMISWYRGVSSFSGTTWFNIKDYAIRGFTVGILNTPNGVTLQGEDCEIADGQIDFCKVAIAYCQRQSDRTTIRNLRSWGCVYTVVDCTSYGAQQGTITNIDGVNVAGTIFQLFSITCQKALEIKHVHAEAFFQGGTLMGLYAGISLQGNFEYYISSNNIQPKVHFSLTNVEVSNSCMRYYDDEFNKRLRFSAVNVRFINTWMDAPPIIINEFANGTVNCRYEDCPIGTYQVLGAHNDIQWFSSLTRMPIMWGRFTIQDYLGSDGYNPAQYESPYNSTLRYSYDCTSFNRYIASINQNAVLITPDANRGCTVTLPNLSVTPLVNDYILDYYTQNVIGRVSSINGNTLSISEIPVNIIAGNYPLNLLYYVTITNANFIGDLVAGSNIITNVCWTTSANPILNTRFENSALPQTTYLRGYDAAKRTITLSLPANKTVKRQSFINGSPEVTVRSNKPPTAFSNYGRAFLAGTVWYDNYSDSVEDKWVFTQGGFINDSLPKAKYYLQIP